MRELKKLFQAKRILALALAIAMAVTMLPTTAYAAPSADGVSEEQSTVADTLPADGEASDSQAEKGADVQTPDGNVVADDPVDHDSTEAPDTDVTTDDTSTDDPDVAVDDAAAGNTADTETDQTTDGEDTGSAVEDEIISADGAAPEKDVYEVDRSNVGDTTAEYNGSVQFSDAEANVKILKNGEPVEDADVAGLSKKWVKKGTTEEVSPIDAGEYQLLVTIPESEQNTPVDEKIDFTITAQALSVAEDSITVAPGTKVSDIKFSVNVVDKDDSTFASFDSADAEANAASKVTVTSKGVKDAITGNPLGNEDVLKKGGDYAITLSFQFTDKASEAEKKNYAMPADQVMDIEMSDLIFTWVEWDYTAAYKAAHPVKDAEGKPIEGEYEPFTYAYTGSVQEPAAGTDYEAKIYSEEVTGKDAEGNDTYKELTGELKKVWYEYNPVSEEWTELEQAPVKAGEYGIALRYEGEEGHYATSDSEMMTVTIEPAILELVPVPEGGTTFNAGTTAKEVLDQVDYQVYRYDEKAANGLGERFDTTDEFDRETFWGTSYDDSSKTQSYQPVFGVYEEVKTPAADGGKEEITNELLPDSAPLEYGKAYRVMFTGFKAVYDADGNISESGICPINAYGEGTYGDRYSYHVNLANANSLNYMVDEDHVISSKDAFTINVAAAAVVDVSAITPISREYNGKPLYENRADYKKAKATVGGTSVAEGTASQLKYIWYVQNGTNLVPDTNADGSVKTDADGNPIYIEEPVWKELGTAAKPKDAGTYRLLVRYYDSTHANASAENEVIYEITPRKIKVVPSGDYSAYTGVTAQKFLSMTDVSYEIKAVTEDADTAAINEILAGWVEEEDYGITWHVEKKDAEKNEWSRVGDGYTFAEGDQLRLAAVLSAHSGNYTDYEEEKAEDGTPSTKKIYFNETKDITLAKMGATALTVTTDLTKLAEKSKVYNGEAFDVSGAVKNGLITIKAGETVVTDAVLPKMDGFWVEITGEQPEYVEQPVDAGTYQYYLGFGGDETYQGFIDNPEQFDGEDGFTYSNFVHATDITYEIKQAELAVTPSIKDEVEGGTRVQYAYDVNAAVFATPVANDKDAFTYRRYEEEDGSFTYGYQAVDGTISFDVFDAKGRELTYGEKLKGAETYTVKFDSADLSARYARNYTLKAGESKTFTTVRSKSTVTAISPDRNSSASIKVNDVVVSKDGGYTHTVTTLQAIPYVYNLNSLDGKHWEGNYIAVDIAIPAEYNSLSGINPMYESSVKGEDGFVLNAADSNSIRVAFDAKEAEKKEFDIRWEEGFTEHFVLDFADAVFGDNLKETVAPKSLAFNGALSKMVVGTTQELDVKLSKSQESDVIHLSYQVDEAGKDFLCVTEDGYVTALKKGSATVIVYSSRLQIDEDGEQTWIPTEPAREAKLKVTVNDVTAPKIKTLTARDHSLTVSWSGPVDGYTDGYRSEIYVLKDKKQPQDFEDGISAMKNGAWEGIFEIAPVYVSGSSYYNSKTKLYTRTLSGSGLSTEETYTVYVRNVSGIRGLEYCDHEVLCKVSESHAGAVKTVKTTKSQLTGLRFDQERITNEEAAVYDEDSNCYTVELSRKNLTMALEGQFREKVESDAADQEDRTWKDLPLSKDDQKNYMTSKLLYCVGEARNVKSGDGFTGVSVGYNGRNIYLYNTPLATIKNEKLTLNGVGKVAVVAIDPSTQGVHAVAFVNITAKADDIKGKTVKMQVGQSMSLYDMVTYSANKKVLIGDFEKSIVVDEELKNAFEADERFELDGVMVTAVKEGKQPMNLTLKDSVVGTDKTAAVKLSVTGLDPVKKVQTTFVTDQFADLAFDYTGYAEAFRIQVKDARGYILQSKYVPRNSNIYNAKTKLYTYRIGNLTQKSKYDVTITALYGNLASKEAKGKIQTTLLPASYIRLDSAIKDDPEYEGGVPITLPNMDSVIGSEGVTLLSGNAYTLGLDAGEYNVGAKYAKTDTLTWTVTNKKVATVKANPGTFTASFKAIGAGYTFVEVRSKITKAVIARWGVTVYPVANADYYHGDNEYLGQSPVAGSNPSEKQASVTSVNSGSSVNVQKGQYKWLSFTAGSTDVYTFSSSNDKAYAWFFYDTERSVINRIGDSAGRDVLDSRRSEYARIDANGKKVKLAAGETVYFAVGYDRLADALANTYVEVTGENGGSGTSVVRPAAGTASLLVGSPAYVSVSGNQFKWVKFTVPEDGTYRFYSANNSGDPKAWFFTPSGKNFVDRQQGINSDSMDNWSYGYGYGYNDDGAGNRNFSYEIDNLSAGETVYIAVGYFSLSSPVSADVYVEKLY